jgi:hypothetical protein
MGTSDSFVINSGGVKLDIAAGYYPMAVAGNLVWLDVNNNGAQDSNEPKISGIKVQVFDGTSHELLKEAITDANGEYNADYLQKKNVYLKFNLPSQYTPTIPRATTPDLDSDVDNSFGPNTTGIVSMLPGVTNNSIDLGVMFGVLPVDWVYVRANRKNGRHFINWATKAEVNLSHYEIERKIGSKTNFVSLGIQISPDKTNNALHEYESVDGDTDVPGYYYYRVKQVDLDGKFTYSDIVYVNYVTESSIGLYPSPSINEANLDLNLESAGKVNIRLYDASSRLISVIRDQVMQEGNHDIKIDLTGLSSGVYNVAIDINGVRVNKKLIKVD